jgi:hypothetical protein
LGAVRVLGRIVRKVVLAEERSAVIHVGERDVGADAGILQGDDVLDRAVGSVPGGLLRMELAAEADSPQQVQHWLVFHDIGRRHQGSEDDAPFAAIDDVVVVVAQASLAGGPHRRGVGISCADPEVAGAPISAM